jgi:secreted trypsin-like serine protease
VSYTNLQPQDEIQTRIIGGSEVNPSDNRYPYFVSMRGTGICGGVLITPSIALTAAHVSSGRGMSSFEMTFQPLTLVRIMLYFLFKV